LVLIGLRRICSSAAHREGVVTIGARLEKKVGEGVLRLRFVVDVDVASLVNIGRATLEKRGGS
jgi:hypothetical protein